MQKTNASITIYSQTAHVRNVLNVTEPMKLLLPQHAELETITLLAANGRIVPFNYVPAVTRTSGALTNRTTGERVTAIVTKDNQTLEGQVLNVDGDNITLLINGTITTIRRYDQVTYSTNDDNTKPYILVDGSIGEVTLSYLLNNITWTCVGTGLYDDERSVIILRLAATITNNTENNIEGQITVVSGGVRQQRPSTNEIRPMAAMAIRAAPYSSEVLLDNLEDYREYNLGQRVLYNKNVAELGTWEIPVIKIYVHETRSGNQVNYGFRMVASDFLPAATINMYSLMNNTIGSYLGSDTIVETPKGKEVDVMIGSSTMIQCESTVSSVEREVTQDNELVNSVNTVETHLVTDTITTTVKNNTKVQPWIILKHFIGNKQFISSTQTVNKIKNGFIEWYVTIPPGQESLWTTVVETKY